MTKPETPQPPAVGSLLERGVGRLRPKRAMAALLHWWRLLTEPEGGGIVTMQPRRWQVRYSEGGVSIGMAYRTACNYAEIFGGVVERHEPPNVKHERL